jgi:hypothetical protein
MTSNSFNLNDYVPVHERLAIFRDQHTDWGLLSEIVVDDGTRIVIRATVTDENGRAVANGHAEEVRGQGQVNRTSAMENAETSAWGRALAACGYEVKRGIASREEMSRANRDDSETQDWYALNGWQTATQHDEARNAMLDALRNLNEEPKAKARAMLNEQNISLAGSITALEHQAIRKILAELVPLEELGAVELEDATTWEETARQEVTALRLEKVRAELRRRKITYSDDVDASVLRDRLIEALIAEKPETQTPS